MGSPEQQKPAYQQLNRHWSLTIKLDRVPICPGCGVILLPTITRFWDGYAVCPTFVREVWGNCNQVLATLKVKDAAPFFATYHGLRFFIPPNHLVMNIVELLERERVHNRVADALDHR